MVKKRKGKGKNFASNNTKLNNALNKNFVLLVLLAIFVCLGVLLIYNDLKINGYSTIGIDTSSEPSTTTPKTTDSTISSTDDLTTSTTTPSSDNWLTLSWGYVKEKTRVVWEPIGNSVISPVWNLGKKTLGFPESGLEFFKSFGYNLCVGFLAGLILFIIYLIIRGFQGTFRGMGVGSNYTQPKWLGFLAGDLLRLIIFAFSYTALMSLPVINSFLKVITFYAFVPNIWVAAFILRVILLALVIGLLPEAIRNIFHYLQDIRREERIRTVVAGIRAQKAVNKEWAKP